MRIKSGAYSIYSAADDWFAFVVREGSRSLCNIIEFQAIRLPRTYNLESAEGLAVPVLMVLSERYTPSIPG